MTQNATAQSAMPQYEEQARGTTRNAAEQRTTPRLEEQRHSIPSHGKMAKNINSNAVAMSTTTAARIFSLPKKRIIKPDYFVVSIFTGFSFSGKVSGVFTQGRLFRVGGRHHCPRWLKPVDCFVKVFLLGLTFRIGYA